MRFHDTVLHMRAWLLEREVALYPPRARPDELYQGDGQAAQLAWQSFRAMATEPAYDPIRALGAMQPGQQRGL